MGRSLLRGLGIAATAWATLAVAAPLVVQDKDFDRESQRISQLMHSTEIVTETGSGPIEPSAGVAGRSADRVGQDDGNTDSGSGWFNSYVEQVNRQLRLRAEAAKD